MEVHPIYVLKAGDELSPVFESPLSLFDPEPLGPMIEEKYGIPRRRLTGLMSPWCYKRPRSVRRRHLAVPRRQASSPRGCARSRSPRPSPATRTTRTSPRWSARSTSASSRTFAQNDPDAYSYSGGLNRANQGILEFVEMFKAPIKMLHPLLTATQEGNYIGTENIGAIPFTGVILAHSNEAEWQSFKANKNNEAFIDRICVIKVPYCLRVTEEQKIYEKLIQGSELATAPCAPATLETLARFSVMSRLRKHENSTLFAKMRVYDGESLKEIRSEGAQRSGISGCRRRRRRHGRRFDALCLQGAGRDLQPRHHGGRRRSGAPDVHAGAVRSAASSCPRKSRSATSSSSRPSWCRAMPSSSATRSRRPIWNPTRDYGQNLFDRYVDYADAWIEDQDFKDPDTGQLLDRELLNQELTKIEKPAGIANPKDFRNEVVKFSLRSRAQNGGKNPTWTSYEKIREVIEKRIFSQVEDLLPVISFGSKKDGETEKKHGEFVARMVERGYTERQVRRLVEWYMRVKQAG